jgi:hypothetical protein
VKIYVTLATRQNGDLRKIMVMLPNRNMLPGGILMLATAATGWQPALHAFGFAGRL